MAVRKNEVPKFKIENIPSKILSSFLNTPATILINRLMYVLLLVSFLVIGFLYGKLQTLQSSNRDNNKLVSNDVPVQNTAQQPPAAPDPKEILAKLDVGHLPFEGSENAPVTIIEFSDFECPFCASFFKETLPQLRRDYIETGKVRLYYRHLPLTFHPQAKPLAIASECANEQGRFWEMHDKIFENSPTITTSTVENHKQWAQELGLNTFQFNECVDKQKYVDLIDEDINAAGEVGATGTPAFYINGQQLMGAQPFSSFKAIIDQELAK